MAVAIADGFCAVARPSGADDRLDDVTARPHSPQNIAPTGNSVPQLLHVTASSSD
jgi:hypothetical protein